MPCLVEAVRAREGIREIALGAHDYGVSVAQELPARDPGRIPAPGRRPAERRGPYRSWPAGTRR
ncbi:hypothetical protein ACWC0C_03830 [Streptomyces sp. NPDC001709]